MSRKRRLLLTVIGVGVLGAQAGFASAVQHQGTRKLVLERPPLWKALPTRQFATLKEGKTNGLWWGIYTYRSRNKTAPCIEEVHISSRGSFGTVRSCGLLEPAPPVHHAYTLFGTIEIGPNKVRRVVTNVGSIFGADVAEVKIELGNGVERVLETQRLSTSQAQKAKVPRFRFVTLSVRREACLRSVIGFDKTGTLLFTDAEIEKSCS